MAVAVEALGPEVAGEYQGLVEGGSAPGRETLQQAHQNVAARSSPPPPRAQPQVFSRGRPVGTSRGGPAPGGKGIGGPAGVAQAAFQHLPSGGRRAGPASALVRLIWAVAVGLIVLQIAAEATGKQWSFRLPGLGKSGQKEPYLPLYEGQQLPGAMPGVFGGQLVSQGSDTNLNRRAGGNLALGP